MSKGQIFTTSLALTITLFIIILGIGVKTWDYLSLTHKDVTRSRDLELYSTLTADSLISTPGNPHNWSSNPTSYGLSTSEPGVLDSNKISSFQQSCLNNYSVVRQKLDIGAYDFSYRLRNGSESVRSFNWSFDYTRDLAKTERLVVVNGSVMVFEMVVRQ